MFTVTGTLDSIPYVVGVHDSDVSDQPAGGCAMGSTHALSFLELHVGEEFKSSPTSSPRALSLSDPLSVLAALREGTSVTSVTGEVPTEPRDEDEHPVADRVY